MAIATRAAVVLVVAVVAACAIAALVYTRSSSLPLPRQERHAVRQATTTLPPATSSDGNDCASLPCLHGGTCTDLVFDFRCSCRPGWTGKTCEQDIDECASAPCLNGGTCADIIDDFLCKCAPGFEGKNCAINHNDCASNPCMNGATCVDMVNFFTCSCRPGYSGNLCQTDIDDCVVNPCNNGGTCVDFPNDFMCRCKAWYSGRTCDKVDVALRGNHSWEGSLVLTDTQGNTASTCRGVLQDSEARVVCHMLFPNEEVQGHISPLLYSATSTGSYVGGGRCRGDETSLAECSGLSLSFQNNRQCSYESAVVCSGTAGTVRLAGGTASHGRLEVYHAANKSWDTVAEPGFTPTHAAIVCRTLGFWASNPIVLPHTAVPHATSGRVLALGQCDSSTPDLALCPRSVTALNHTNDVGVNCSTASISSHLKDGLHPWQGRLEVTDPRGVVTSVCPAGVNQTVLNVACKGLGYRNGVGAFSSLAQSTSYPPVQVVDLQCKGTEADLSTCTARWKESSFACQNTASPSPLTLDCSGGVSAQLVGGDLPMSGRVQILSGSTTFNVRFGTVDLNTAKTICSTLGYRDTTPEVETTTTRYGSGPELATTLTSCLGQDHVAQCIIASGIRNPQQAGVRCFGCGRNYTSESGTITSELYPSSAPGNRDCLYHIQTPGTAQLYSLRLQNLQMQGPGFLEIRDTPLGPPRVIYSNTVMGQTPDLTFKREVYVRFKTDASGGFYRFLLTWNPVTLRSVTTLGCTADAMTVQVNVTQLRWLFPDTRPDYISLFNEACTGSTIPASYGEVWSLTNPHSQCWTQRQISSQYVTYRNALIYKEISSGPIVREHRFRIDLACNFIRRNQVSFTYNLVDIHSSQINQSADYQSVLTLYNDSSLAHPLNANPIRAKLGQDLYVKVELSGAWNVSMRVDNCSAAPSDSLSPSVSYQLIRDGCPTDSETHLIYQSRHATLFHFKAFEFYAGFSTVYLSCEVHYCSPQDHTPACNRKCLVNVGRRELTSHSDDVTMKRDVIKGSYVINA